ncbi:helix-turn-helix domain-containing protein [Thiohalocapsa sp.]|uniref:response regulator transcription factor n=1 Tax=Thiohalocapsa sp. TaxID=2497641 RepID=UPI0025CF0A4D|nr:helix-turn-helix domain-containing protein [Thiohalocapsa sp.]
MGFETPIARDGADGLRKAVRAGPDLILLDMMRTFEYLREQRLVRAQELLDTTNQQIQQIAEAIGFKRASDFGTAFKHRFGVTPRDYRKPGGA